MKHRAVHTSLLYSAALAACLIAAIALAIVVPRAIRLRAATAAYTCIGNLQAVSGAKSQWAVEYDADSNAAPSWYDLRDYLADFWSPAGFQEPRCPCGGTYTIGRVADAPTCSFPKHSLALAAVVVQVVADFSNPAGSPIVGATVEVLDETGRRTGGVTGPDGGVTIQTWPNKPIAVITSKSGFLTSTNDIQTIRSCSIVHLQKIDMGASARHFHFCRHSRSQTTVAPPRICPGFAGMMAGIVTQSPCP